jgi:hypothetical protein
MKMIRMYEEGDLLTAYEVADLVGYSRDYVRALLDINDKAADPRLIRLKIDTDATWRKANNSRVRFVFEYSAVKERYAQRQRRRTVKNMSRGRSRTPSPVL